MFYVVHWISAVRPSGNFRFVSPLTRFGKWNSCRGVGPFFFVLFSVGGKHLRSSPLRNPRSCRDSNSICASKVLRLPLQSTRHDGLVAGTTVTFEGRTTHRFIVWSHLYGPMTSRLRSPVLIEPLNVEGLLVGMYVSARDLSLSTPPTTSEQSGSRPWTS